MESYNGTRHGATKGRSDSANSGKQKPTSGLFWSALLAYGGYLPETVSATDRAVLCALGALSTFNHRRRAFQVTNKTQEEIGARAGLRKADTVGASAGRLAALGVVAMSGGTRRRRGDEWRSQAITYTLPVHDNASLTAWSNPRQTGIHHPPSNGDQRTCTDCTDNEPPATERGGASSPSASNDNGNGALKKTATDPSSLRSKQPFPDGATDTPPPVPRDPLPATAPRIGQDGAGAAIGSGVESSPSSERRIAPRASQELFHVSPFDETREADRETCWTEFLAAWKERTGGDLNPKRAAKVLGPVRRAVGHDEALSRWREYLRQTPPQYCSLESFASKHGAFKAAPMPMRPPTAQALAARFRAEAAIRDDEAA